MPGHRLGDRLVQREQLGTDVLVKVGRDDVIRQHRGQAAPTLGRLGPRATVVAAEVPLATWPLVGPEPAALTTVTAPEAALTGCAALTTVTAPEATVTGRAGTAAVAATLVTTLTAVTTTETTLAVTTAETTLTVTTAEATLTRRTGTRTIAVTATEATTLTAVTTTEATSRSPPRKPPSRGGPERPRSPPPW
ncbi:Conserved hypothetical protein [Micromonospora lupini str. Lupac 08]|uniref:Uncharacterized protein n=1 Tax=Micromonospora lupini str. Lupac 08 TaxID=1150864 RepID=I0L1G7_9ACTN|nr:Conserved hypothetical protein [Micromonospora lupini str. Lupac 08]